MNQESTNQVQGQESASIVDTATIQNQLFDTSNIQLQTSEVDKILQNSNLDKIVNMTSSLENLNLSQFTATQASSEGHKNLLSIVHNNLTWIKLNDSTKSVISNSFVEFQGFSIPMKELIQDQPGHLQSLNSQQIIDILQHGVTKVSTIDHLITSFYIKRTFIQKNKENLYKKRQKKQVHNIFENNFQDLKQELKEKKCLIIADNFGTGKTTTLKYLARRFKSDDYKLWISYIDARLCSNIFDTMKKIVYWNVESLSDFMVKILGVSGIEVPIFKQKFIDNQVILLWDHIDEKFQSTLIDFAWKIKQLSENQQIFATQIQNSKKLTRKFTKTCYKFIPLTSDQIKKFHRKTEELFKIDPEKYLQFCDSIELGVREYENGRKVFMNNNILLYKLSLQAFIDLDCSGDLYSLFERVFKKQLMDNPLKLKEQDEIMLSKFLQFHALKEVFGDELIESLQIVKDYANPQLPISSLNGIFAVNFDDNSVDFQHKIIKEYFITTFIMDNIINVNTNEVTRKDAKILVRILTLIMNNHTRVVHLINLSIQSKYKDTNVLKKLQKNFNMIFKQAQYWTKMQELCHPQKPTLIDNIDGVLTLIKEFDFWEKFYRCSPCEEMRNDVIEKVKKKMHDQIKNKCKNKPSVKGETSMKKLSSRHEISNQLDEFLDYDESDDSYDTDGV